MPVIVPAYAAILALIFIFFSTRVIRLRQSNRISLGAGGNPGLERAIRVHGNFAEYVPLGLLLLLFMELQGRAHWLIHILCLVFIAGRLSHAYAIGSENTDFRFRVGGMVATFFVLTVAALSALGRAL
jgi:uncharacterized membrane protein YecN with MAPEG domain